MLTPKSILTFVARMLYHIFKVCQILLYLYFTPVLLLMSKDSSWMIVCLLLLIPTVIIYSESARSPSKLWLILKSVHGLIVMVSVGVFMVVTEAVSLSQLMTLAVCTFMVSILGLFVSLRIVMLIRNAYGVLLVTWVGIYLRTHDFGVDGNVVAFLMFPVMVEGVIAYLYLLVKSTLVTRPIHNP